MIHAYYRQQYQINGGKMDSCVAWTDGGGRLRHDLDPTDDREPLAA